MHYCLVRSSCRTSRIPSHEASDGILSVWQIVTHGGSQVGFTFRLQQGNVFSRFSWFSNVSLSGTFHSEQATKPAASSRAPAYLMIFSSLHLLHFSVKLISHFGCLGRLLRTHHSLVAPWSSPPSSTGTSDMLGFVPYSAGAKRNLSGVMASSSPPMLT